MGRALLVSRAYLATLACAVFVAGCGSNEGSPEAADGGVPESTADASADIGVADTSGGDSVVDAPTETATDAPIANGVAEPTCSPTPGTFTSAQMVTLSDATPGATIRFTLDGTNPNANSTLYTTPFQVMTAAPVRFYATAPGLADSGVVSCQYVVVGTGVLLAPP